LIKESQEKSVESTLRQWLTLHHMNWISRKECWKLCQLRIALYQYNESQEKSVERKLWC